MALLAMALGVSSLTVSLLACDTADVLMSSLRLHLSWLHPVVEMISGDFPSLPGTPKEGKWLQCLGIQSSYCLYKFISLFVNCLDVTRRKVRLPSCTSR